MEGIPEEDLKEHERQKQGGSKGNFLFNLIRHGCPVWKCPFICMFRLEIMFHDGFPFNIGAKNSDSEDEQPQPKKQKNEHHHNPGLAGLPHGMMPPNIMPSQFGPMMGHMGHVGPPFMGGG